MSDVSKPEPQSKYSAIIRVARADDQATSQPDDQISGIPENQVPRKPDNQPEKLVNLCVKVPENLRRHWAAEAKRQGVTMTDIMMTALEARFGKP